LDVGAGTARSLRVSVSFHVFLLRFIHHIPLSVARHVYGYSKMLDGDGDPERADGYGPVQQV
jgi:hypothetical protein